MRILVCGGRDYGDLASLGHDRRHPLWEKREAEYQLIHKVLGDITWERRGTNQPELDGNWLPSAMIIAGGASGVDKAAVDWAIINWCNYTEVFADWSLGRKAGPLRNQRMLDEEHPDLVVAFPGGRGTANMVSIAKKAGVEVIEVAEDGSIKHRS